MKVLLDRCVGRSVKLALEAAGHTVAAISDWPTDPGDKEILRRAFAEEQLLITIDKDFGTLAVLPGQQHREIIRFASLSVAEQVELVVTILEKHEKDLRAGAIITASSKRLRIRPGHLE